jgi:pyridoxal/pyridoxine/pyridoxamine kinase
MLLSGLAIVAHVIVNSAAFLFAFPAMNYHQLPIFTIITIIFSLTPNTLTRPS